MAVNLFNLTKEDNPLAGGLKGNLGATMTSMMGSAGSLAGKLIGDGYSSGAGNVMSSLGNIASNAPKPFGSIVGGGLDLLGGITNRLFGTKVNEAALRRANEGTAQLNNFVSDASVFDDVQGPQEQAAVEKVYTAGLFGSTHGKNNALKKKRILAQSYADRSVETNIDNIKEQQLDSLQSSFFANGGKIFIEPSKRGLFTKEAAKRNMGVQEFANKVLANKNNYSTTMIKRANFAKNSTKWKHSFGGDLLTNGAIWDNGLTFIGNGGTHEANPYEGVQVGVDPEGTPNLVEEGEVIWNDYVFSNRLKVPKDFKKQYKLNENKDITFAEAANILSKEIKERPNDPISKAGRDTVLSTLMDKQEEIRERKAQREARNEFNSLSPEEQLGIMQMAAQQEAQSDEQLVQEGPEEANIAARGGNLFPDGSSLTSGNELDPYGKWANISMPEVPYVDSNWESNRPSLEEEGIGVFPLLKSKDEPIYTPLKPGVTPEEATKTTSPTDDKEISVTYLNESGRYAPIWSSGIEVLTDALGLTNKPDYSNAEAIEAASNITPKSIRFTPLGNYLTYTPLDRNNYLNQLRSSAGANRRQLANLSGGNRGAAMAALIANDYNTLGNFGKFARAAEEYNAEQKQKIAAYNNSINMFNSENAMKADSANQSAWLDANKTRLAGIQEGAKLRALEDERSVIARSKNLTNFIKGIRDLGQENAQSNWLRALASTGYFGNSKKLQEYLNRKGWFNG